MSIQKSNYSNYLLQLLRSHFLQGLYNIEPQLIIKPYLNSTDMFSNTHFFLPDDEFVLKMIAQTEINDQWKALIIVSELWKFVDVED